MQFDDTEPYELNLWIESNKTTEEFESSLSKIIVPLTITNHQFALGNIIASINYNLDIQPPKFPGVPEVRYSFRIDIPTTPWNFWASFDRIFGFAVLSGLRSKFDCKYLMTADMKFFTFFSGTNLPHYFNELYPPFASGELGHFLRPPEKCVRLSIPKTD